MRGAPSVGIGVGVVSLAYDQSSEVASELIIPVTQLADEQMFGQFHIGASGPTRNLVILRLPEVNRTCTTDKGRDRATPSRLAPGEGSARGCSPC
jgi:hypothetical protein